MGYLLLKWTKNYFYVMAKKEIIDLFLFAFFYFRNEILYCNFILRIAKPFCGLRHQTVVSSKSFMYLWYFV
jgi:hypothetical protein